jgi:hypothetical protein
LGVGTTAQVQGGLGAITFATVLMASFGIILAVADEDPLP